VGDVSSWVDSLVVSALLRFYLVDNASGKQLTYVFQVPRRPAAHAGWPDGSRKSWVPRQQRLLPAQEPSKPRLSPSPSSPRVQGVDRLGLVMQQFAIAASAVSIVVTLAASAKWPEASGWAACSRLPRCSRRARCLRHPAVMADERAPAAAAACCRRVLLPPPNHLGGIAALLPGGPRARQPRWQGC
jgi:hypothetical protein